MDRPGTRLETLIGKLLLVALLCVSCRDPLQPEDDAVAADGLSSVVNLGTLGGSNSEGFAIRSDSSVIGVSKVRKKGNWVDHAFLWSPAGGMQDLTSTSSENSTATDLNSAGAVVGYMDSGGFVRAFRLPAGGQIQLLAGFPNTQARGYAWGINGAGQAVGRAWTDVSFRAVLWETNGSLVDLGVLTQVEGSNCFPSGPTSLASEANAINDQGVVVGWSGRSCGFVRYAVRWSPGTGIQPLAMPFGQYSVANDVNADGTAVGFIQESSGYRHAVLWTASNEVVVLGTLGGSSEATGINNAGVVVGTSRTPTGEQRAFFWNPVDSAMVDLVGHASRANDISIHGAVTGVDLVSGQAQLWHVSEVPFAVTSVQCNPVLRGGDVSCEVHWVPSSVSPAAVTFAWEFQATDSIRLFPSSNAEAFAPPPAVNASGQAMNKWDGIGVLGGSIKVRATWQQTTDSASTTLVVSPRTGADWGNLKVSFSFQDTLSIPTSHSDPIVQQPSPYPSDTLRGIMGANVDSLDGFAKDDLLQEYFNLDITEVPSGPNEGLGYVRSTRQLRVTRMAALRTLLTGKENAYFSYSRAPGGALTNRGLLEAIHVDETSSTRRFSADSSAFRDGVMAHEYRGAIGGRGHQGQFELAAAMPASCGRVPAILERVVAFGTADAGEMALTVIREGKKTLLAAAGHNHVHSNYQGAPTFETISDTTAVASNYQSFTASDHGPLAADTVYNPDPRYHCTRSF